MPKPTSLHNLYKLLLNRDDFSLVVGSAGLADSVGNHEGAALAALHQRGIGHFPIGLAAVSASLGRFILRANGHLLSPPIVTKCTALSRVQ